MKKVLAMVLALAMVFALCACGNGGNNGGDSATYDKITLTMAVNGTDTQVDSRVANHFKELVEEATDGAVQIEVYPNDQLAGGNASKGVEMVVNGSTDIAAYATVSLSVLDPKLGIALVPWTFSSYEQARQVIDDTGLAYYDSILQDYGLTAVGSFHNGFRQLSNNVRPVTAPEDLKGLKIRVPGGEIYMDFFRLLGADPTNMNWSETYTALQQKTVEGQENPLPAIDAASVQEVQPYCSMWNAIYDCLFFCINGDIYDSMTPEQQEVIDECGRLATEYEREINRAGDDEIMDRWQNGKILRSALVFC